MKKKKKKLIVLLLVGVYIAVIVCCFLFVPVKATIGDKHPETVYGYSPVWELSQSTQSSPDSSRDIPVTLKLNIIAWILQLIFITLVFISLLFKTLRYFKDQPD